MNNFYISFNAEQEYTAWYKAIVDVEFFLDSMGFKAIPVKSCIKNMRLCLKTFIGTEDEEDGTGIILVQYPRVAVEGVDLDKFIKVIKSTYQKYKLVVLVHDLDSIRFGKFFTTNYLTEIPMLKRFHCVIAVNDAMAALLKDHGVLSNIYSLTMFDYVLPDIHNAGRIYDPNNVSIAYAGNLKYEKSPFLYKLDKVDFGKITINLYGPDLNKKNTFLSGNVKYKGAFAADSLADEIKDEFGLCWDGNSLDKCGGKIGMYLRYTNPHKTSFYLALGIPVIISKDISTAEFIEREKVGIIISKIEQIPSVINNLSMDEYENLKINAVNISKKLREGYFIKKVIKSIEESFKP